MLLHRVVRQVYEWVVVVFGRVLEGTKAQVTLTKEIDLVVLGEHRPHADVEFALVDEHGTLNVFLNHKGGYLERVDCGVVLVLLSLYAVCLVHY